MTLVVDAHHHLWDPAARDYPWMRSAAVDPIRRRYDLDELRGHAGDAGVDATVVVQTVSDTAETAEFLAVAVQSAGLIAGVVGWVDLTSPDIGDSLTALTSSPGGDRLVGARHQVEDEPDPAWLLRDDVSRGLAAVAEARLVYDILVRAHGLTAATAAVDQHPDLAFVLDHAGKPPIASGELDDWRRDIAELASRANVTVKLSGLVTEADWRAWTIDDLRPVAEHLLAVFGPTRMMFGTDWPVCELASTYEQVVDTAEALCEGLSPTERDDMFGGTAARVYGLTPLVPPAPR